MAYVVTSLPAEPFAPLFAMDVEALAQRGARRVVADAKLGFPCRVSLDDAEPGETLIHGSPLEAVHPQPASVVMVMAPPAPPAPADTLVGLTLNAQPEPCVTWMVLPATSTVPLRCGPEVAAMSSVTEPSPEPLAGFTAIQGAWLVASQAHP